MQLYQKQVFLGKRVTLSAESTFANILYEKKVDNFNACANSAHACSDCLKQYSHMLWLSHLDQVDPTGWAKMFIWRKLDSARRVTLPDQLGFWETAHLPLPIIFPKVRIKC